VSFCWDYEKLCRFGRNRVKAQVHHAQMDACQGNGHRSRDRTGPQNPSCKSSEAEKYRSRNPDKQHRHCYTVTSQPSKLPYVAPGQILMIEERPEAET
jgi:hypothetical protein